MQKSLSPLTSQLEISSCPRDSTVAMLSKQQSLEVAVECSVGGFKKILALKHMLSCIFLTCIVPFILLISGILTNHKINVLSVFRSFFLFSYRTVFEILFDLFWGTVIADVHRKQKGWRNCGQCRADRSPWGGRWHRFLGCILRSGAVNRTWYMTWRSDIRSSVCPLEWSGQGQLPSNPAPNRSRRPCPLIVVSSLSFFYVFSSLRDLRGS